MELVNPSFEILTPINRWKTLKAIERYGRTCYKSEDKITDVSSIGFVKMLVQRGHLSVIEHINFTVKFICDRGITHELRSHRLCSFSQESTRYCNYYKKGLRFINMSKYMKEHFCSERFKADLAYIEDVYNTLIIKGMSPQIARSILPNCLAAEIVVTANLRQWRTIFLQRTSKAAHPQMREIMTPLCRELQTILPEIYGDIETVD